MDAPMCVDAQTPLDALIESGKITACLILPGVPTPTASAAAAALGVAAGQIIKSLLFTARSGELVLAIASGDTRIDRKRLAVEIGALDVSLASPETVLRATGYAVGGVSPVGHVTIVPVIMDERVLAWSVVYGGGGRVDALLEITPAEIRRVTGAKVVGIDE